MVYGRVQKSPIPNLILDRLVNSHPSPLRTILVFSLQLHLDISSCLFPSDFATKVVTAFTLLLFRLHMLDSLNLSPNRIQ